MMTEIVKHIEYSINLVVTYTLNQTTSFQNVQFALGESYFADWLLWICHCEGIVWDRKSTETKVTRLHHWLKQQN